MDGIFLRAQAVRKRNPRWCWRDGGCAGSFVMPRPAEPELVDRVGQPSSGLVVLRRPAGAPEISDEELDLLQTRHLAYRAELKR